MAHNYAQPKILLPLVVLSIAQLIGWGWSDFPLSQHRKWRLIWGSACRLYLPGRLFSM
uniref:hypothetical protein n=1 Tax=Neorhizobium sp. EC2-8 TaxID=3129230 RepID=UPI003100C30E